MPSQTRTPKEKDVLTYRILKAQGVLVCVPVWESPTHLVIDRRSQRKYILSMDTRKYIEEMYGYWVAGERDQARAMLHDDFEVRTKDQTISGADKFFDECWKSNEQMTKFEIEDGVFGEDAAYVVYNGGQWRVAEFHKFRDGKVALVRVTFDPVK